MTMRKVDTRVNKLKTAAQSMGVVVEEVREGNGRSRYVFKTGSIENSAIMGSTVGLERAWIWLYGYGSGWTRGRLSVRSGGG